MARKTPRWRRRLGTVAVAVTAAATVGGLPPAAASTVASSASPTTTASATPPPASAWVVVDVNTGRVVSAHDDHTPLPPGSLTKVLVALIARGWLAPSSVIPVTANATTVYPDRIGMKVGQRWPLDMTMHALLVFSANDAAYALADKIGGSLRGFISIMNEAANQLHLADHPVLHDPAGLDGSEGVEDGNRISARDLAIAGRDLLAQPYLARIVDERTYSFTDPGGVAHDIENKNHAFLSAEPGAIGVKTGFTDAAGMCTMGAATRNGRTMLVVVLHGDDPTTTATDLLAKAFATPAAAEPTADALPPVVAPRKPAPPATTTTTTTTVPPPPAPLAASAAAPRHGAAVPVDPRSGSSDGWIGGAAAGAGVAVAGAGALWWRRRRERNAPAHRRRKR